MIKFRNFLKSKVEPVIGVPPAERVAEKERELQRSQAELVQGIMAVERRSWEVRQALAGSVINIVSGDSKR